MRVSTACAHCKQRTRYKAGICPQCSERLCVECNQFVIPNRRRLKCIPVAVLTAAQRKAYFALSAEAWRTARQIGATHRTLANLEAKQYVASKRREGVPFDAPAADRYEYVRVKHIDGFDFLG